MSDPRIRDVGSASLARLQGSRASMRPPSGFVTLVASQMTSPRGVMVVIPLLIAVLGLFLTAVGQKALQDSNLDAANERLSEQTQLVAASIRDALAQADPLLDRVSALAEAHDPQQPFETIAHAFAGLMRARAGITYISVSFTDGTFQGAYIDTDHVLRFQDSRVGATSTHVRRYDLAPHNTLKLQREDDSTYDPRQRGFYQLALKTQAPAWTDPYPFFDTHQTGITRTAPVFVGEGDARRLHAVVTVDFDVHGLSSQLSQHQLPGTHALLFARDGSILAYATDNAAADALPQPKDRVLSYRDLKSPVIDGLFSALPTLMAQGARASVIETDKERYLIAIAAASNDGTLPWSMAYFANEDHFLGGLKTYRHYSALIAFCALIIAIVIAFLFARSITRARKEIASAKADAEQARKQAKELGSYRLVACLGKGAMGEVWRAEHRLLAREAAIKLINPALLGKNTAEIRGRFRREAETLAALRSRNTIELFDYGVSEDGTFFFVMELLDGMDLETLIERHGPISAARAVPLLIQACCSLAEAHDRGLVHRDIKPANIFICRAADEVDVVKVLDFGLVLNDAANALPTPADFDAQASDAQANNGQTNSAQATDAQQSADNGKLTHAGGLMGTPAFMPPEQAMGQPIDGRSDLYALACVAVWLLTGKLVFDYTNPMHLLVAHMNEDVPDLREKLPPSVPDALVTLLTRCLQKQPADRPHDMREFSRALRAIKLGDAWSTDDAQQWWLTHHQIAAVRAASNPPELSNAPTLLSVHDN